MLKKHLKNIILTSVIILLPLALGLVLWGRLPDTVATHFNAAGEPDGWSSKFFAVVVMPFMLLAVHLFCLCVTVADPKRQNIGDKLISLVMWITPALSLFCGALTYSTALGMDVNIERITPVFLGLIFIIIGNFLPKCQQNYTVGIKVPWTLHDSENWNSTHRFAGKVWTAGGLLFTVLALVGAVYAGIAVLVVMALAPMLYSYLYYRKHSTKSEE